MEGGIGIWGEIDPKRGFWGEKCGFFGGLGCLGYFGCLGDSALCGVTRKDQDFGEIAPKRGFGLDFWGLCSLWGDKCRERLRFWGKIAPKRVFLGEKMRFFWCLGCLGYFGYLGCFGYSALCAVTSVGKDQDLGKPPLKGFFSAFLGENHLFLGTLLSVGSPICDGRTHPNGEGAILGWGDTGAAPGAAEGSRERKRGRKRERKGN